MQQYLKELDYFNRTYSLMDSRATRKIKFFMQILLDNSSVEELRNCYYSKYKKFDLKYKQLEKALESGQSLEQLKFKVVSCSVDKLHSLRIF